MMNIKKEKLMQGLLGLFLLAVTGMASAANYDVFKQVGYIKATTPVVAGEFGRVIAVAGDTMVVGAPMETASTGAIYVLSSANGWSAWTQEVRLTASGSTAGDQFGMAVAISEDETTIIVGAPGKNADAGAVYVFTNVGGTWTQTNLTAGVSAGARLGWSVSISGDIAIAGAPGANADAGAAYNFVRSGSVWTAGSSFKVGAAGDGVGIAVAISSTRAVVGAYGASNEKGAIHMFTQNGGGGFFADATFPASPTVAGDWFGKSVAISGDTVVVGAPRRSGKQGLAYVASTGANTWTALARLSMDHDFFGAAVAIEGTTVVIGAPGRGLQKGSAYVFENTGGSSWSSKAVIAYDRDVYDFFGSTVATESGTVLVGAQGEASISVSTASNNTANHAGATYAFKLVTINVTLGDATADNVVDIRDVVKVISMVMADLAPTSGSDCDNNGEMTINDILCTADKVLN